MSTINPEQVLMWGYELFDGLYWVYPVVQIDAFGQLSNHAFTVDTDLREGLKVLSEEEALNKIEELSIDLGGTAEHTFNALLDKYSNQPKGG